MASTPTSATARANSCPAALISACVVALRASAKLIRWFAARNSPVPMKTAVSPSAMSAVQPTGVNCRGDEHRRERDDRGDQRLRRQHAEDLLADRRVDVCAMERCHESFGRRHRGDSLVGQLRSLPGRRRRRRCSTADRAHRGRTRRTRPGQLGDLGARPDRRIAQRAEMQVVDLLVGELGEPAQDVRSVEAVQQLGGPLEVPGLPRRPQCGTIALVERRPGRDRIPLYRKQVAHGVVTCQRLQPVDGRRAQVRLDGSRSGRRAPPGHLRLGRRRCRGPVVRMRCHGSPCAGCAPLQHDTRGKATGTPEACPRGQAHSPAWAATPPPARTRRASSSRRRLAA